MYPLEEKKGMSTAVMVTVIASLSISIFVMVAVFQAEASGGGPDMTIILSIFAGLIVLILAVWGVYRWLQTRLVSKPEIAASTAQAKLGQTVTLSYKQRVKRDISVEKLSFKLILRESATYQRGTDTYTVTHDHVMDEFGYTERAFPAGHIIEDHWQVQVPRDGMHTFVADNNKIQWFLQIHVDVKNTWPDFKRDYELPVMPALTEGQAS